MDNMQEVIERANKAMDRRRVSESLQKISRSNFGIYGIRTAMKDFEASNFGEDEASTDIVINAYTASCLLSGIESLSELIRISLKELVSDLQRLDLVINISEF